MCGIAGIFDLEGERPVDARALARMTQALGHRGPDGEGFHIESGLGLGHRRLAIIDMAGGVQPFTTPAGAVLSYNGEIYNFKTLRESLRRSGGTFRTHSDTEVLALGLEIYGADFIEQLTGMFAFAVWSPRDRRLTLVRDRLGEKPLYYGLSKNGWLVFASEMNALLASGFFETTINTHALSDYFLYGYVPDPKTIYNDIHKLPPGCMLNAQRSRPITVQQYWSPSFSANTSGVAPDTTTEAGFLDRLDAAVENQLISDAPLGAFLSGGVDSSAVVSSMHLAGADVTACTIGFDGHSFDERPLARKIAAQYVAHHHEESAALDVCDLIDPIASLYGEPFADTSALPTYLVSKAARSHVTVALSGDGGDEVFAGYRRYPMHLAENRVRGLVPNFLRRTLFRAAGAYYPKLDWAPRPMRLKTTLQSIAGPEAAAYARTVALNLPDRVAAMLSPDFQNSLDGYSSVSVVEAAMSQSDATDPLSIAQAVDLATWLPGRMLTKVDRASMAHGLEVRAPFLDHQLIEWAGQLPPSLKLRNGVGKWLPKKALEKRLPSEILYRNKQGFDLPIRDWLRNPAGPLTRLHDSNQWRNSGVLNDGVIEMMMKRHHSGIRDYAQELWTVIMFDAFLNHHGVTDSNTAL